MNEIALFARDLKITLGPTTRSRDVVAVTRATVAAAQVAHRVALGYSPNYKTWVDGRFGGGLDTVKPNGGRIEIEFDFIDPSILRWISARLREFSPVKSGRYQRSHVLLADGVEVDPAGTIPPAKEFVFLNSQPYARPLERGLSPQRPEGVYQAVAILAQRRSNMEISYGLRPFEIGEKWIEAQPAVIVKGVM